MGAVIVGSLLDDRYQIMDMIGAGGLGRVFKAKDLKTGNVVAIKFLHDHDGGIAGKDSYDWE